MRKIYLAADSGGSKTTWVLVTSDGEKILEFNTKGMGAVKENILPISDIIKEAAEQIKSYEYPESIYLSLGGPNVSEVLSALQNEWGNIPVKVEREASGNAILYVASYFNCSSVIMCGTGSTAMGNTEKGVVFSGGWGPIYGDDGSGGGMGAQALRLFLRHIDGIEDIGAVAQLFSNLTEGIDIQKFEGRMELKARALNMSRRELACMAPEIYNLAQQGDLTAKRLYQEAADEVAIMADVVSVNDSAHKVLLCGGFFANKPEFVDDCKRKFKKLSNATLYYNECFKPIVAAEIAVLRENAIPVTKDMFNKILKGE